MNKTFKALRIDQKDGEIVAAFTQMPINLLTSGEVIVKVEWSGINYKDALAATGKAKILRQYPLNGGIDLSGTVVEGGDSPFKVGDKVLVCGAGLSETRDGGYAEYARLPADIVMRLPEGLDGRETMAIGTAGFSAALAVDRLQQNGLTPELGPIVVTGASGGVGSFAINILAQLGYDVVAFSGNTSAEKYLSELGASRVLNRHDCEMGTQPLEKAIWGGAVDNVGGDTLNWLTRTVVPWGSIASVGLAGGIGLNTTVMPFILRGVSLLGINSIELPNALRDRIWTRLATDLKPQGLEKIIHQEISFDQLPEALSSHLSSDAAGRTLVRIGHGSGR